MATKRTATVEEVLAAVEAARDKVMADEIKSLTKLGIPKAMAYQMIASRFGAGLESCCAWSRVLSARVRDSGQC